MKTFIKGSFLFGLGICLGSLGATLYLRKKNNEKLDYLAKQIKKDLEDEYKKDIQPDRDAFTKAKELAKAAENKPSITNYTKMYSGETEMEVDTSSYEVKTSPRVIDEADLYAGDGIKYAGETLTLYADGILTNSNDEPVKNVQDTIGEDFLAQFYGSEETSVFIRNDDTLTDYEIIKSSETYASLLEETSEEEE